jgi:hypothetical protein
MFFMELPLFSLGHRPVTDILSHTREGVNNMHRILLVARLPTQMIICEHPIARVYARRTPLWPGSGPGVLAGSDDKCFVLAGCKTRKLQLRTIHGTAIFLV